MRFTNRLASSVSVTGLGTMRRNAARLAFALAAALPAAALAGTATTATLSLPPGDVAAGSTIQVNCRGEGSPTMGAATSALRIDVTVSGGTVAPAQLTGAVSQPCSFDATRTCSVITGAASWATPAEPGTYTATCTGVFQGVFGGPQYKAATASVNTVAAAALPPVVGVVGGPTEVVVGSTSSFDVVASDPNTPALPLSYAWTATGGTVVQDAVNPAAASWQAPADPGVFDVTVTVSNGVSSIQAKKTVSVVLATYQAGLPLPLVAPRRIASSESGALFAIDGRQGTLGQVVLVTARGETRGFATLPEPALAAASGAGFLWVTTTRGSVYKVDPATGRTVGKLNLAGGSFATPSGIAYDARSMTLWVADVTANRVRVITPDGATVAVIDKVGGAPLAEPTDVAVDAAAGKALVLVSGAKREADLAAGEPVAAARFLHAFDLAGQYLASYVPYGGAAGQITRAGGLTVDAASRVYVSDIYQGAIQVVTSGGASVGIIGSWGSAEGQLMNPMGLAVMGNGDLAVANTSLGRIERFGTGVPLPTCAGDTDCDGLSDAWETANGLNPAWAGDALLDLDGDGLNNAEELAAGTNPRNRDTDGDGYSDRDELLAGFDPLNPNDHTAVVSATGPAEVTPGLVRLSAVASGAGTCGISWKQAGGSTVSLRNASTATPEFIARTAGAYDFDAVATCSGVASAPGRVRVVVRNVAPLPDAGRVLVASPGSPIRLDALASSDANGDPLTFAWDQTLGSPIIGVETGGTVTARPRGAGLYAFQVTVTDAAGASATAEVPVVVAAGPVPTAIAAAVPAEAQVGGTVVLDGSASLAGPGASYAWQQVAGPQATLAGADQAVASFAPPAAGRYAFEVLVRSGQLRSPPARVEVFVAAAGAALPTVTASAPSVVAVNAPVSLDATATGGAVTYAWRQVSGPAAGLSGADAATATAVAFAPGFYVFEVSVNDGAAESRPARVAFEARAAGKGIPQARIAPVAGDAWVGQLVFLDGRASTGGARFRWTQVAGPWVALGAQASVTSFRPLAAGRYAFELEVDDGTVRSAPARVEVNVVLMEGVR